MPRLALRLFGPMEVTRSDGTPLPRPRTRAGLWLLALLALKSERPQERARLAQTLWPDTVETAALANLRRTLTDLRRVLGPDAEAILAPSPATLQLDLSACEIDVARFDADPERELSLYRGELLEGCAEEWVFSERRARAEVCRNARLALARNSSPAEAAEHLEAALALEPLDESVARALMESLASEGKISEVLGVFRRLREGLRAQRLSPEPETAALFAALREKLSSGSPRASAPLPGPLTSFVGREAERETLLGELDAGSRLLTLLGPGGVGKTRLARELAAALPSEKPLLGFVDCSAVVEANALPQALTRALDLRVPSGRSHADVLETALDDGVLLLDNLEQVQGSLAPFLTALLSRRPLVQIVATSRTRLRVPGEFVIRLCGLPRESASRLFAARAVAAGARRETLDESAVETLCERLDGLPLALELAASWSELLAPPEILARLGERFALLKGRSAERGLEATLEWSWARLPETQKAWLHALALLPGAWTRDVGAATLDLDELPALDAFAALADASWLVLEPGRCRMLESLRAFVHARTPPEARLETLERLWHFWERRAKTLPDDTGRWMRTLDDDLESLRLTLDDALARPERAARGLSLLLAADVFFGFRGLASECLARTEALLARLPETDPIRPQALGMAGGSALWTGEIERARRALEEAVALCPEKARERAYFLGHLGVALRRGGDLHGAERWHREAYRIHVEEGRKNPALLEQMRLGVILRERGELDDARIALREAGEGDELLRAGALAEWARLERQAGDFERSAELYAESLTLHRALGNQPEIEKLLVETAG